MAAEQIEAIEIDISKAKTVIDFASALTRLKSNKDFKDVILKGYFETEAIRLVHLKASAHMQSVENQSGIVNQIDAIGLFSGYLNAVFVKAAMAERSLEDSEETLAEIYKEQADHKYQGAN